MKKDAMNRRSRFAGRQPTGKQIILSERDFAYFAALERHGPLPANYLFEMTQHIARNHKGHQQRLTDLYNEANTPHHAAYLERPEQQYASINARYQPMAYELTSAGQRALRDQAIALQAWTAPSGPYVHRFMTACITASIELAATGAGFRYLSQADIFAHPKCPIGLRAAQNALALPVNGPALIPDQLFGIDYGGRFRFFALEADRKTETIVSAKAIAKSFARKLEAYVQVLEEQTFKQVWGIPTLTVMTVTTSETHMDTMMKELAKLAEPKTAARFIFKTKSQFGKYWTVPPLLDDLFAERWARVDGTFDISTP